jgi:galactokinase
MPLRDSAEVAEGKLKVKDLFQRFFGESPEITAIAPGRVNLIGEHTDYNDGFVFPVAIDRHVWIAAKRTEGPTSVLSAELGEGWEFDAKQTSPGDIEGWSAYPAGVAWALCRRAARAVPNIEAVVTSDIPIGSGISSSAALGMAFATVWNQLAGLGLSQQELALACQDSENRYVGISCGVMDPMASGLGKEGHAMFLDTRSLEITYVALPQGLTIALCDTGVRRQLLDSAYNDRRTECVEACEALGVKSLRDGSKELLERRAGLLSPLQLKRARHVISENDRCQEFLVALQQRNLEGVERNMRQSHESLRDDYEVSCPELDAMAESAWAAEGCIGARMTGAGFGGACIALVQADLIADFITQTAIRYKKETGLGGNFMACRAVDGARTLS